MIEMVVVLGMVAAIMALASPSFVKSQQAANEERFWHELKQQWRLAQTRARVSHRPTRIEFEAKQVEFHSSKQVTTLALPATLRVTNAPIELQMMDNGYVRPLTVAFTSTFYHCRYELKVQLAWGGYRLEKMAQ